MAVRDQLRPPLEDVDQRHRTVDSDQRSLRIDFDHRQPTAFDGQCIPGRLDPEFVDLRLPGRPIDDPRKWVLSLGEDRVDLTSRASIAPN